MSASFTPEDVEQALAAALQEQIVCVPERGMLRLDTPFVLQDGHSLRVYLSPGHLNGDVIASDGGFATGQVEMFVQTQSTLRQRYADLQRIATELGIEWDVDFRLREHDLTRAIRRLAVLARAVDRALTTIQPQADHVTPPLVNQLQQDFKAAGFTVKSKAQILVRPGQRVHVDLRLRQNDQDAAAIEVLSGRTVPGARTAIDEAVADFHILAGADYSGLLVAVWDENSAASTMRMQQRFNTAKPAKAILIPGRRAVPTILEQIAS